MTSFPVNRWRAGYNTANPYRKGDIVTRLGVVFICKRDSLGHRPYPGSLYWDVLAPGAPDVNVKNFGAVGDGSTDDTAAIQAAIDACAAAGGGTVLIPPGTYQLTAQQSSFDAGVWAALFVSGYVTVRGGGMQATTLRLADDGGDNCSVILNAAANIANGDQGIVLAEFSVTDDAGTAHDHTGVSFLRASDCYVERLFIYGFKSSGPETFALEFALSADMHARDCVADGNISGFSADGSLNVGWTDCVARNGTGNGFTHNGCDGVTLEGCVSYGNGTDGFNSETSIGVMYSACSAGGKNETGGEAGGIPDTTSLGNTNNGFTINGSTNVRVDTCSARHNGGSGLNASGGAEVQVNGGDYGANTYGVIMAEDASISGCRLGGNPNLADNSVVPFAGQLGDEPHAATLKWVNAPPAIPASGTEVTNTLPFPVMVYLSGGTVTGVHIDTVPLPDVRNAFRVQPGGVFKVFYSVVPDYWSWQMDLS